MIMKKNKIHNIVSVKLGLAMLMLFGILSMAKAQETLTVSPIEIVPGEEAEVTVAYESDTDRKSFQMNITLPQGLTYVASEENGKIVKLGDAAADHIITEVKESESLVRIIAFSMTSTPFVSGKNLISFRVKAADDLAAKSQIEFSNVKFAGGEYIEGLKGDVTRAMAKFDMLSVVPSADEVVNSLSEIVVTMSAPVGGVADGAKAVISKDGVTIEEAPIAIEAGSADVKVVLTNAITESGVYTMTIAEGLLFDEKYDAADPLMSGAKCNSAIAAEFKVMGRFAMKSVTPDAADVVEKLSEVVITMSAPVGGVSDGAKAVVTKDGETVDEVPVTMSLVEGSTEVIVTLNNVIETNGKYVMTIPEGVIFDEKYDAIDPIKSGAKCNEEIVLEFEVVIFDGINGINVDASGKDRVYTIGGVRVNGKLAKGVYIINGKKVVINK